MNFSVKIFLPLSILLILSGCSRTQPIYNIENQGIPSISKAKTANDVKKAIHAACLGKGWKVRDVANGVIEATLMLRTHTAVVEIRYDTKKYSILYKDSTGLDGDGQAVHKNYNGWIRNLDNDIQKNLALI